MIVRVTRAKIRPNAESAVFEILRRVSTGVRRPDGMDSLHFGRRMSASGNELISITIWTDLAALEAAMGTSMEVAAFLPELQPYLLEGTVEHFETITDRFEELAEIH
jgi:heme-degrading monooxygenase HmoA